MYRITLKDAFHAVHSLKDSKGKCEALHKHHFKVEVDLGREALDSCGMVIDFLEVRPALRGIVARWERASLNELPDFKGKNPSVENIARRLYEALSASLKGKEVSVECVTVWETEDAGAAYIPS
ncbi:MAG: 6-carboxytetrahydropterin synthase [Candidatus Omnitrophota bacterium]